MYRKREQLLEDVKIYEKQISKLLTEIKKLELPTPDRTSELKAVNNALESDLAEEVALNVNLKKEVDSLRTVKGLLNIDLKSAKAINRQTHSQYNASIVELRAARTTIDTYATNVRSFAESGFWSKLRFAFKTKNYILRYFTL